MRFVITNASTLCSDADVQTITSAVAAQLVDVAGSWGREVPGVDFAAQADYAGANFDVGIVVLDDSDQAGALGYHSTDPAGRPYARVFARDSISGLTGVGPSTLNGVQESWLVLECVAQVISHEAIEALIDPDANDWADEGNGSEICLEGADPVESSSYIVQAPDGRSVTLSDYVLPAWFNPGATEGPYDRLGQVTGPFQLAVGGYAIEQAEGQAQAVFGADMAHWRRKQHERAEADARAGVDSAHLASRTGKRFARTARTAPAVSQPTAHPDPVYGSDYKPQSPEVTGVDLSPSAQPQPSQPIEQPQQSANETDPTAQPQPTTQPQPANETDLATGSDGTPQALQGAAQPTEPTKAPVTSLQGVTPPNRALQPGEAGQEVDNSDPEHPVIRSLVG